VTPQQVCAIDQESRGNPLLQGFDQAFTVGKAVL